MWSQNLLGHTVWAECGKPATSPSQGQSIAVTASWPPCLASLCQCSGALPLLVCHSGTSGLLLPSLRLLCLSYNAWLNSTQCSYALMLAHSLRQWGRYTAMWGFSYTRRAKCWVAALLWHEDHLLDISLTLTRSTKHQMAKMTRCVSFLFVSSHVELI